MRHKASAPLRSGIVHLQSLYRKQKAFRVAKVLISCRDVYSCTYAAILSYRLPVIQEECKAALRSTGCMPSASVLPFVDLQQPSAKLRLYRVALYTSLYRPQNIYCIKTRANLQRCNGSDRMSVVSLFCRALLNSGECILPRPALQC